MTVTLSFDEAHTLVARILETNGCSPRNATVIATTVIAAERDGAGSHGLFRMPGYVATLKSGWLDGKAVPKVRDAGPGLVAVDANNGFAQVALADGRDLVTTKAGRHQEEIPKFVFLFLVSLWTVPGAVTP